MQQLQVSPVWYNTRRPRVPSVLFHCWTNGARRDSSVLSENYTGINEMDGICMLSNQSTGTTRIMSVIRPSYSPPQRSNYSPIHFFSKHGLPHYWPELMQNTRERYLHIQFLWSIKHWNWTHLEQLWSAAGYARVLIVLTSSH